MKNWKKYFIMANLCFGVLYLAVILFAGSGILVNVFQFLGAFLIIALGIVGILETQNENIKNILFIMYGVSVLYHFIFGFFAHAAFLIAIVHAVFLSIYYANPDMPEKEQKEIQPVQAPQMSNEKRCPKCGGNDLNMQIFQENTGSTSVTHASSQYKEKGHGCLWWLLIGWWWWIVDLMLWIFAFFPRLILRIFSAPFKKKKYTGSSQSVTTTSNNIRYKTLCVCKTCGYSWKI